jgi:hypothetical protein
MVLVVRIVNVSVLVLDRLVDVFVGVALSQVEVDTDGHQRSGDQQLPGQRLMQQSKRED